MGFLKTFFKALFSGEQLEDGVNTFPPSKKLSIRAIAIRKKYIRVPSGIMGPCDGCAFNGATSQNSNCELMQDPNGKWDDVIEALGVCFKSSDSDDRSFVYQLR